MPVARSAAHRVKERISLLMDERVERGQRVTRKALAKRIGLSPGSLSDLLNSDASTRGLLAHLDEIADYLGVTPSELVKLDDTGLHELTPQEATVMRHWREWPASIRARVWGLLLYFSAEGDDADDLSWRYRVRQLDPIRRQQLQEEADRLLKSQVRAKGRR